MHVHLVESRQAASLRSGIFDPHIDVIDCCSDIRQSGTEPDAGSVHDHVHLIGLRAHIDLRHLLGCLDSIAKSYDLNVLEQVGRDWFHLQIGLTDNSPV
jgi:hypothetical protein